MVSKPPPKAPNDEAREVGEAQRILRERRGVTQEQAAEAMRVSRTAYQNYENGRQAVMRTDLQSRMAEAVGATREDLLAVLRELQRGQGHSRHSGLEEPAAIYAGPGRAQAIFPTAAGDVIVSYPAHMTDEARRELSIYLTTWLKMPAT